MLSWRRTSALLYLGLVISWILDQNLSGDLDLDLDFLDLDFFFTISSRRYAVLRAERGTEIIFVVCRSRSVTIRNTTQK